MRNNELVKFTALEAVAALKKKQVSPLELINAAMERIEKVENNINALPVLCRERAVKHAKNIMEKGNLYGEKTWLAGLPIAIKDLTDVAGVRTTYGSGIYADHVPEKSDILVETLERRGAVVLAKSNTPEFGAGGNTFNEVFGKTLNPWNPEKTCGGSSGGSAAALAAGEVWLATGSDLGGSLRTPASFCSVVGLRPGPGRIARGPADNPFDTLSMEGPMGRNVRDTALMLDAMCGANIMDPLAFEASHPSCLAASCTGKKPATAAFSPDLGGITPVDSEVSEICKRAALRLTELGIEVEEASPDFSEAGEAFQFLRAELFATETEELLRKHREQLKPEVVWNIEKGLELKAGQAGWARRARGRLFYRTAQFFQKYDLLLTPAAIVPPFNVEIRYVTEVEGYRFDTYIDWLLIASAITLTSCPALSLPCGFTRKGLPVGLQVVGKPRGEAAMLRAAALLEETLGIAGKVPVG